MIRDVTDETQHVPDGPDATRLVPDGPLKPEATRVIADGPSPPTATRDLRSGSALGSELPRFGRFVATARLGDGGMGTVFRARDEVLGRDVAIKALHDEGDAGIRERFVREARAIGAILHPHILAVYDAGDANGVPYIVMEVAGGGSLRDRIKQQGTLPAEEVRQIGIQIARALGAAHARGIIHRDVKPANILCTQPGTWKLADFGIARLPDSTLTVAGQFLGSPSYAAPESLGAAEFFAASDVYGLAATLYEALTGAPPHGDDMQSIIRKLEADPPRLETLPDVPGPLGASIMAALSRDPNRRPSAEQLAQQLADTGSTAAAVIAPGFAPATAAAGSHRMKLVALAVAAIAGVAIVLAANSSSEPKGHVPGITRPLDGVRPQPSASQSANGVGTSGTDGQDGESHDAEHHGGDTEEPWAGQPSSDPYAPGAEGETPMVVDQFGNPVDEETAKQILEQMQRDAESASRDRRRGRGRWKKHRGR